MSSLTINNNSTVVGNSSGGASVVGSGGSNNGDVMIASTTTTTTVITTTTTTVATPPASMSTSQPNNITMMSNTISSSQSVVTTQQLSSSVPNTTTTTNNSNKEAATPYHPFHNGGILMIMPNGPSSFPPSLRKLRHVKSILCRNLIPSINSSADLSLPNAYFTLHAPPPHRVTKNKSRYRKQQMFQMQQEQQKQQQQQQQLQQQQQQQQQQLDDLQMANSPSSPTEQQQQIPGDDIKPNNLNDSGVIDDVFEIDELDENSVSAFKIRDDDHAVGYDNYIDGDDDDDDYEDDDDERLDDLENDRLDGDNEEELTTPFYISEVVPNSYNPVWNPFDCYQPLPEEILECFNTFNICIWDKNHNDEPLFQSEIDLTQLEFISQEKNKKGSTKLNDYKFNPTVTSDKRKTDTVNQDQLLKLLAIKLQNMKYRENCQQLGNDIECKLDSDVQYMERIKRIERLKNRVEQLKEECCNQLSLKEKEKADTKSVCTYQCRHNVLLIVPIAARVKEGDGYGSFAAKQH
ncbi:hypothetical protein PPL_06078 [Heterostelium album PN500]|uniref:Uncharacterized protein n=1 Tax=Heterostelium pallidum (strain ATCC 26659 / Pp 5 / PN500) TaxID=670386 RepID=D3BC56_HETP5|nr:hypothetical protein PPL_06078 [Heterostelium album PN500]EFA81239.1 hypothetical protein PPL_06078 [Heterostelium album PN500]|eukprot:XP_020433357.1 hypothetical protein PPL_06078 [Heterostelium album PN500]